MSCWRLAHRTSGQIVVERLSLADTFWGRLCGLQFRRPLPAGTGLLLVPCGSIHTMWMRFAIDVAMLDRSGRVLYVRRAVRPWRYVHAPRGTHAVLETAAGDLKVAKDDLVVLHGQGSKARKHLDQFIVDDSPTPCGER